MHRAVHDLIEEHKPTMVTSKPKAYSMGWAEVQELYDALRQHASMGAAIAATNAGRAEEASVYWASLVGFSGVVFGAVPLQF